MKKLVYLLFAAMVLFLTSRNIYASEGNSDQYNEDVIYQTINGDLSLEEGAEEYFFTAEEREKAQAKLAMINQMRISFPSYTELAVPWFKQQNGYYCGPATVKQVLHYINNTSETQDTYANELGTTTAGTDMTRIPGVLNSHINGYEYNYYDIGTAATWLNYVRTSLYNNKPAVLDIDTTDYMPPFGYPTEGHFVNVSGYNGVTAQVKITDPNDTDHAGNYWYSVSDLYGANNAHWRKAIIW